MARRSSRGNTISKNTMLQRTLSAVFAFAVLSFSAVAQDCSQLNAAGANNGATQTLTFDVTGSSPLSFQALVFGQTPGQTTITLPSTTLTLGLARPFFVAPLGIADLSGNLSVSFEIPTGIGLQFHTQSAGVQFVPTLSFCTSNVASINLF